MTLPCCSSQNTFLTVHRTGSRPARLVGPALLMSFAIAVGGGAVLAQDVGNDAVVQTEPAVTQPAQTPAVAPEAAEGAASNLTASPKVPAAAKKITTPAAEAPEAAVPEVVVPKIASPKVAPAKITPVKPATVDGTTPGTVAPDTVTSETATPETATPEIGTTAKPAVKPAVTPATQPVTKPTTQPAPKVVAKPVPKAPASLTIASWAGAYLEAQDAAIFKPFSKQSGIKIETAEHSGGSAFLTTSPSTKPTWDIADLPYHVAVEACSKGLLETIDATALKDANGRSIALTDFLPDAVSKCAVGSSVWSSMIAYDTTRFKRRQPTTIEDLFDLKTFPGKRGLPMRPRYILEMALMADGVAPEEVYATLGTDAGAERAFDKLGTIRRNIVWWQSTREPAQLLLDGKVAMAIGFSGRFYMATAARQTPIEFIWDGQIYDMDVWVIPKTARHMPTAMKFLSFALQPKVMARQASLLPYGPTRKSASRMVKAHATLPIQLASYLPTAPDNFGRALHVDEAWWARNNADFISMFRNWIDGKPLKDDGATATTVE